MPLLETSWTTKPAKGDSRKLDSGLSSWPHRPSSWGWRAISHDLYISMATHCRPVPFGVLGVLDFFAPCIIATTTRLHYVESGVYTHFSLFLLFSLVILWLWRFTLTTLSVLPVLYWTIFHRLDLDNVFPLVRMCRES